MGCCFSHESDNELGRPHRPQTYFEVINSFQPSVTSTNSAIVQSPSRANSINTYHATASTNRSRLARSQWSNEEPVTTYSRPHTNFEANNSFQPSVPSVCNVVVPSSNLRAYNSNSYHATTSNHSRLENIQRVISGDYESYSTVKTVDSTLYKRVLELTVEWYHMNDNSWFELCLLFSGSWEYEQIHTLFKKTTQKHFVVDKIYRIQNPYLLGCYLLKKEEMKSRYGHVGEEYLFHGTKLENQNQICTDNFDWRKHGNSTGNIYGKGISFSPISCYASHYSDKRRTQRIMFVSKVLIAKETIGNRDMTIPPIFDNMRSLRYDTASKENRHVIVKFSDNEFYPSYVVHYTGQYEKREQKQMRY